MLGPVDNIESDCLMTVGINGSHRFPMIQWLEALVDGHVVTIVDMHNQVRDAYDFIIVIAADDFGVMFVFLPFYAPVLGVMFVFCHFMLMCWVT